MMTPILLALALGLTIGGMLGYRVGANRTARESVRRMDMAMSPIATVGSGGSHPGNTTTQVSVSDKPPF